MDDSRDLKIHFSNENLYNKIKVDQKVLEDAVLELGSLKHGYKEYGNKKEVIKILAEHDKERIRDLSNYYYNINGIYQKVCNAFAFLYRYDWYIVPEMEQAYINSEEPEDKSVEKFLIKFHKVLQYFDRSYVRKITGDIALKVIRNGCFYGYICPDADRIQIQELPTKYCRTRFKSSNRDAVEFNMKFFDDNFPDVQYRMRVLKMFPKEFMKGYVLYKQHKLPIDKVAGQGISGIENGGSWYLLDTDYAFKMNLNDSDMPIFVTAIPEILDLDAAVELDKRRSLQRLLKILVQKLPLDKNFDLVFDVDEAADIHQNAVEMLQNTIGVSVLTTFADVEPITVSTDNASTVTDELLKRERAVFNAFGTTQNIFNAEGNIATSSSILNDESAMRNMLFQFEMLYDSILQKVSRNNKKAQFRFHFLETTQYNYQTLSKMYKEQTQIGFSKMLPQIALGHCQSEILNSAYFENEILDLPSVMIPPLMSSVMSGQEILGRTEQKNSQKNQNTIEEKKTSGRTELPDSEKSDKTIANRESMGGAGNGDA